MGILDGRRNVKVKMDDGSHKMAEMVEGGGVFVCHAHQYITDDLEQWNIHIKTGEHVQTAGSTGKCVICGTKGVDLSNHPAAENPVCPKCEERLIKSRQRVHAKLEEGKKKEVTK
jgi:hypothetical protein